MNRFRISIAFLPLLAWFSSAQLPAQTMEHRAALPPASANAYYNVLLPPSVSCLLDPEFGNLRLRDSAGQDVPFIMKNESAETQSMSIEWLPRVRDSYWAHWYSRTFFMNDKRELLDRLALRIRNADVQQRFWLSGSDDMEEWYIIKEDYVYDAAYDPNAGSNLVTIHFPPVDYKYFKVELRHFWREPIQIMGAGVYRFDAEKGNFQEIKNLQPAQQEQGSESIVDIPLGANHYVDRVFFEIDGPELYFRSAVLQAKTGEVGGVWKDVKHFNLSSQEEGLVALEGVRAWDLRLVIDNKDDRPLRIAGARAWQTRKYMVAHLDAGQQYDVWVGEPGLRAPSYDLAHFESKLPKTRSIIEVGKPVDLRPAPVASTEPAQPNAAGAVAKPTEDAATPFFQHPAFLWGAIGLVVLVIGFMAVRMLKDIKVAEEPK